MQKAIVRQVSVPASREAVWDAFTTEAGARTFFAPECRLELAIGGPYEMLFDLDKPPGLQGGEGLRVLSYVPRRMLSFEWNAPPEYPEIRKQNTWVVLEFSDAPDGVQVVLTHLGWGQGDDWDAVFAYFETAWTLVMARLARSFTHGPVDWRDPWRPAEL